MAYNLLLAAIMANQKSSGAYLLMPGSIRGCDNCESRILILNNPLLSGRSAILKLDRSEDFLDT